MSNNKSTGAQPRTDVNSIDWINKMMEGDAKKPMHVLEEVDCSPERLATFSLVVFTDGGCTGALKASKGGAPANAGMGVYIWDSKATHPLHGTKIAARLPPGVVARKDTTHSSTFSIEICETHPQRQVADYLPREVDWTCSTEDCINLWTHQFHQPGQSPRGVCSTCRAPMSVEDKTNFKPAKVWELFKPTSIRAEGLAMLTALQAAACNSKAQLRNDTLVNAGRNKQDKPLLLEGTLEPLGTVRSKGHPLKVLVVTDSQFWINVVTNWMDGWIAKKILFEKKNTDILCAIHLAMKTLDGQGIAVEFQHIRGHQDEALPAAQLTFFHKGNVLVDKLATHAMTLTDYNVHIA